MGSNHMKTYINKTRFQKRIVFVTDEKAGKLETVFLRSGQKVERKEKTSYIEDGIKVREAKSATAKKVENSDEGKE